MLYTSCEISNNFFYNSNNPVLKSLELNEVIIVSGIIIVRFIDVQLPNYILVSSDAHEFEYGCLQPNTINKNK